MSDDIKDNLSNADSWLRVLLVLIFALVFTLAAWVLAFSVTLNLLFLVFTGQRNDNLARFGDQIARYLSEVMAYATLNSDDRPFPFGEWPDDTATDASPSKPPAGPKAEAAASDSGGAGKPAAKKSTRKKAARKAARKATRKTAAKGASE